MKTVGRLDKESMGLIVLMDNGSFSRLLCDPEFGLGKTYRVVVRGSRAGVVVVVAVSNMIRWWDAAGVLPVEDRGGRPGAGHGTVEDQDHNNNRTIKQCT